MLFPVNQGTGVVVAAGSATGPVVSSPEETGETVGLEEMGGCKEQASVSSNTIGGKNRAVSFKKILLKYINGMIDWGGGFLPSTPET